MVEGIFDDSAGFLLPLIQARRETLYLRVLYSTLYYTSEGVSTSNRTNAEAEALQDFKHTQVEKICMEYETLRVRLSSPMTSKELRKKVEEYVSFSINQNASLLEYLDDPDPNPTQYKVYLVAQKSVWDELTAKEIDTLYQQVRALEETYQENTSLIEKLQLLEKMRQLLDCTIFGLPTEDMLFGYEQSSQNTISSRRTQLIDSINLHLVVPKTVKEGESCTVTVACINTKGFDTEIPVKCTISDNTETQRFSELGMLCP